jgi:hypothetical protein
MSLPKLLKSTKRKLKLAAIPAAAAGLEVLGGSATVVFWQETQQQGQWCWAAVTVSISAYYNSANPWTQCTLVNAELNKPDCCVNGSAPYCDRPWTLNGPLAHTKHLQNMFGVVPFQAINTEIESGRPVACRIRWTGGAGHFVVLHGSSASSDGAALFVSVADPLYGPSTYSYDGFRTSYRNNGVWTHSYYTK